MVPKKQARVEQELTQDQKKTKKTDKLSRKEGNKGGGRRGEKEGRLLFLIKSYNISYEATVTQWH